jgi:hypothetical protein
MRCLCRHASFPALNRAWLGLLTELACKHRVLAKAFLGNDVYKGLLLHAVWSELQTSLDWHTRVGGHQLATF